MDGWEGEGLNEKIWKRARSGGSRELSSTTADVHAIPVPPSIVPSGRASHSCRARARADTREHESKRTPELFALSKGLRVGEMGEDVVGTARRPFRQNSPLVVNRRLKMVVYSNETIQIRIL